MSRLPRGRASSTALITLIVAGATGAARAGEPSPAEPLAAEPSPAETPAGAATSRAEAPPAAAAEPVGKVSGRAIDTSTQEGLPGATVCATGGPGGDRTIADGDRRHVHPRAAAGDLPDRDLDARVRRTAADGHGHHRWRGPPRVRPRAGRGPGPRGADRGPGLHRHAPRVGGARRAPRGRHGPRRAISAEQIARSPDGSASDAAKRMVAATIQDNRYVVIRGLGGRYSLTLLNGVPLPSPDPIPAAPLDLFPASLIHEPHHRQVVHPGPAGELRRRRAGDRDP